MKLKSIIYWTTTLLTAGSMGMAANLYFTRNKGMMDQFRALDMPDYMPSILGTAKVLGVAAIVAPQRTILKEWAYAGFTFTFLGAAAAHLAKKNTKAVVGPLVSLAVLTTSYLTRPADRRLPNALEI